MEENCFQMDPRTYRYARFKSRQLARTYGFLRDDAEDIEHELLLDYLQRSRASDGRRCSRQAFVRLVINHRVATLIDFQKAACRDYRLRRASLDDPVAVEVPRNVASGSPESWWQLKVDLGQVLDQMPVELAHICSLIINGEGASDIVARAGISRATLYRRLCQIRSVFERAGLRRYLT